MHTAHTRSVFLLIATALCWSLGGVLIKSIDWPPLAVAGGRGFIAALFLLATSRALRFHFSRVQLLGALGYAACTVTFCVATKLTTAANAILLQYSAPIWIALFGAWFLGERATRADWFTIAAVLLGAAQPWSVLPLAATQPANPLWPSQASVARRSSPSLDMSGGAGSAGTACAFTSAHRGCAV